MYVHFALLMRLFSYKNGIFLQTRYVKRYCQGMFCKKILVRKKIAEVMNKT